jgi:hypothetical protein
MRTEWIAAAILLAASGILGCGTDPQTAVPNIEGATSASSARRTGTAASQAPGSAGKSGAAAPIACGTKMCEPARPGLPASCCADPVKGICSALSVTQQCVAPPAADPRCPSVTLKAFNATSNGCCTEQGMCGSDASAAGMGCIDLGDPMFRMIAPDAPAARRCDDSAAAAAGASASSTSASGAVGGSAAAGAGGSTSAATSAQGGAGATSASAGASAPASGGGACPSGFTCTMVPVAGNACTRMGETASPPCMDQNECSALLPGATCMMVFGMSFCSLSCTP